MSVRGERIVYKERDREWEEPRKTTYTTVKRYKVPESTTSNTRKIWEEDEVKEDRMIVKRDNRRDEEIDYRVTERISERSRDPPRRDVKYKVIERDSSDYNRRPSASRSEFRVVERDREVIRAPSPPSPERTREWRFEREREFSPPRRQEQPYELERYSKSTEFFQQPQPIIIRESAPQPIIIREERREPQQIIIRREEPHYEFIEREEVKDESRSLVRREEPPSPAPVATPTATEKSEKKEPDEDYFYERRIIERKRPDEYDRRTEIRPRDSASQYSSDDSYEYVRRERVVDGSRSRDHSPHHKRHLAEGALAGIAAGEIVRHHKKSQGEKPPGRGRSLIGGAALGAVGAEALSRVRSLHRGSRSRSRSSSREFRRDRRDRKGRRSRSRSKSMSRVQQLGGLAAVAAVGALAGYALKKGGNKDTVIIKDGDRRSRSRRRRGSYDSYMDGPPPPDKALNPEHRNRRIAQAGLASAAAAGIWEKVRSRSRPKSRQRSKSRLRTGVPIAAAGLGGAALAGLYEKNKASKEAKKEAIIADEMHRGRGRRSRSRSRSLGPYDDEYDRRRGGERDMIAYGNDPIYPDDRPYYSDEEPGMYRRRHNGGSSGGSSPDNRRRSRSRNRHLGEAAAVGAAAGFAGHEMGKRRERSRADRERRGKNSTAFTIYEHSNQHDLGQDPYGYDNDPVYSPPPMGHNAGYFPPGQQQNAPYGNQQYPNNHYFPPPPTDDQPRGALPAEGQSAYPTYNPADYGQSGAHPHGGPADYAQAPNAPYNQPYGQSYAPHGESEANLGAAPYPPHDTYAGDARHAPHDASGAAAHGQQHEGWRGAEGGGGSRDPENVSVPNTYNSTNTNTTPTNFGGTAPHAHVSDEGEYSAGPPPPGMFR